MFYTQQTVIQGSTLGQLLHFSNTCKDKILDHCAAPYDLTSAQFKILLHITFRNITNPMGLSQTLRIDNGAITRLLDRLELKGFLIRVKSQQDRRQTNIVLTEHGKKVSKKIPEIAANALNQLTDPLTENEVTQLEVILKKMLLANGYQPSDFEHDQMDKSECL